MINTPSTRKQSRLLQATAAIMLLSLASCMHFATHQGNVLKPAKLLDIRISDSRFHVESVLGSPVLKDELHPNHAIYIEDFKDEETGTEYQRRIEIIYSGSGRVKTINRHGFNTEETKNHE
ncbi:MAG: outer membrane protein assembly factor BamE [Mariprofundaceae bacterium]